MGALSWARAVPPERVMMSAKIAGEVLVKPDRRIIGGSDLAEEERLSRQFS